MPSSTRSNKNKQLLFSEDPAHLERSIRKDQRSTSMDAAAFTSTDSRTHPSTDTRPSSLTDLHRSPSIDTTSRQKLDTHGNVIPDTHVTRAAQPVEEAARPRALADYNRPDKYYVNRSAVRLPEIQKQNFELKPQYYTLVSQIPYSGKKVCSAEGEEAVYIEGEEHVNYIGGTGFQRSENQGGNIKLCGNVAWYWRTSSESLKH
ncbi:hypothetical protein F2Q68_00021139 [Brassica cretica]|uniref:Uncharacterized protein n=1 Tax=Brassica cretica TaxID=69181 RepID=A0A8S9FXT8_BRACR|nr:hypothetical protein F2Q68_00021139 [Brassica cretica]